MTYSSELRGFAHWVKIIPETSPCGEDLSLEPDFEALSAEIGKDKSIHGDQRTDWVIVYELADALLSRSKDLWPFAYGIVAVYYTKNVGDCIACVNSLTELLSTQWQSLYPALKRPKRRIAPLKWLCDKFQAIAANTAFLALTPNEIGELNAAFIGLQEKLDSFLPDNDLAFRSIFRAQLGGNPDVTSSSGQQDIPASPRIAAPASRQAQQSMRATLGEIEKRSIIPSAALPQIIRAINENARQLGDHLLAVNPEDERAYQLHRVASWSTLLQLPPSDAGGLTQLSCPIPPDMIDLYTTGVSEKRYSEMLPQIERAASKAPFWFDGQHLIVKCLEGLSAALPAFSVKHSLAQLVKRFPAILALKFKDGIPFASPKTATWIDSFLPVVSGNGPSGTIDPAFAVDFAEADEAKLLQGAIAQSLETDFKAGLGILGKVQPGKNRAFFRHNILKAKYCSAAGQPQAAIFILRFIIGKLKLWDLLDWEPELTTEAVSLLLSLSPQQKEPDEELQSILHAISLETATSPKLSYQNRNFISGGTNG
jgi:type VI secretion system protein VasJ